MTVVGYGGVICVCVHEYVCACVELREWEGGASLCLLFLSTCH